jgi:hypothetical protein
MAEENFRPMGMHRFPYRPDSEVPVPLVAEGAQLVITAINSDAPIEAELEDSPSREYEMGIQLCNLAAQKFNIMGPIDLSFLKRPPSSDSFQREIPSPQPWIAGGAPWVITAIPKQPRRSQHSTPIERELEDSPPRENEMDTVD